MKIAQFTVILLGWMCVGESGQSRPLLCCLTVTYTRIPAENIVDYTIQEPPICPIRAVRFLTRKNKIICSDPESDWAMKVMKVVDGRTTTKPTACSTCTTTMFPTTTHKTPGPETETSESTTDDHPDCCLSVTNTRVPVENIEDYHIQELTGVCALRAVRFLTKKNRYICSDPDGSWAKRAMESVDRKRRTFPQGYGHPESCCSTAMSTTIPVNPPVAFRPLLNRKRSHSKKRLRKYQSKP